MDIFVFLILTAIFAPIILVIMWLLYSIVLAITYHVLNLGGAVADWFKYRKLFRRGED